MSNTPRFAEVSVGSGGTPLEAWERQGGDFPVLDLASATRLVVVGPHPDDEVLGVGGVCALAARLGVDVDVLLATDGTGSHPRSPTVSPEELGLLRAGESARAAGELGLSAPRRLRFVDGQLASEQHRLADVLAGFLKPGDWCLATWRGDGHPDHEAVGAAAAAACDRVGARLLEYPVWMWHWAQPQDPAVPWDRARLVPLPPEVVAAKLRAVEQFQTQIAPLSADPADAPILPRHVLDRLCRATEMLFL